MESRASIHLLEPVFAATFMLRISISYQRYRIFARQRHSEVLNCGYSRGYSIHEVIAAVERASKAKLKLRGR